MSLLDERLDYLLNAGEVQRFHTIRTIRPQDIANHSWRVAIILLHVWPDAPVHVIKAALYHDVSEYFTGDVPATAKWCAPNLKRSLNDLDDWIRNKYDLNIDLTEEEKRVLKWCDHCDLALRSWEEYRMGNTFHGLIVRNITRHMNSIETPLCCLDLHRELRSYRLHTLGEDEE